MSAREPENCLQIYGERANADHDSCNSSGESEFKMILYVTDGLIRQNILRAVDTLPCDNVVCSARIFRLKCLKWDRALGIVVGDIRTVRQEK